MKEKFFLSNTPSEVEKLERDIALSKRIQNAKAAKGNLEQADLSEEQREELSTQIVDGFQARDELVQMHMGLAFSLMTKYLNKGVEHEDLAQIGKLGLTYAANNYDWKTGNRFSTYAYATIDGTYKKAIERQSRPVYLEREMVKNLKQIDGKIFDLNQRLLREPSVEELIAEMNLPRAEVIEVLQVKNNLHISYLEADPTLHERIEDKTQSSEDDSVKHPMLMHLMKGLNSLDEKERKVLHMRYFESQSQAEIAKQMSTGQSVISRIEKKALDNLRELFVDGEK